MRRVRYAVAASLDGYIAGPNGEADWVVTDPDVDFESVYRKFDTILVGRRTFEPMVRAGRTVIPGMKTFVFSRTLRPEDHPEVTVVAGGAEQAVAELRAGPGKDIWLFGGGQLFAALLNAGLVDAVEVAVMPVLLGCGTPLLPPPAPGGRCEMTLVSHKASKVGIVSLEYAVRRTAEPPMP